MKKINKWNKKFGYREDYDIFNRWQLKRKIKGYLISTVDLGLDYSFGTGEPLYYETMIFKKDSWEDLYCERYSTKKEAKKGHKEAIKYVKERVKNNEGNR